MKKYFTLTLFLAAYTASAQVLPGCLSDMMRERLFLGNPAIRLRHESMEQQILQPPFPRLTAQYTMFLPGTYWVNVSADCFSASDTIRVFNNAALEVDLGPDTVYCERTKYIILRATPGYDGYIWQDGSLADTLSVTEPGIYWVNVNDGEGCFARDTIEVAECPLAIERKAKPGIFIIYPNPVSTRLFIETEDYQNFTAEILNIQGQVVQRILVQNERTTLPAAGLPAGAYFIRFTNDRGASVSTFIKG